MTPYFDQGGVVMHHGEAGAVLTQLESDSVDCVVTSPPYWGLRDYGVEGQLGLEKTPAEYLDRMTAIFEQVRRVLKATGTLWLNMGDSYHSGEKGYGGDLRPSDIQSSNRGSLRRANQLYPNRLRQEGLKAKDLVGMPWALAFALRGAGWYLRSDIIWSKPNPMPESVTDRPTKAHEYLFLLSKSARYYYDADAIREAYVSTEDHRRTTRWVQGWAGDDTAHTAAAHATPKSHNGSKFDHGKKRVTHANVGEGPLEDHAGGKNKRSVWTINPQPFPEAHFATFPEELVKPCILAGCPAGGVVLDPFLGSGTTALVARQNGCRAVGIELNAAYIEIAKRRLAQQVLPLTEAIA